MLHPIEEEFDAVNIFNLIPEKCGRLLELILDNLKIYKLSVDKQNANGETLLHQACAEGMEQIAEKLIKRNANVNIIEKFGYTPLHFASEGTNVALVELLVKNGAIINMKDAKGENPIFKSVRSHNLKMLKYYLSKNVKGWHDENNEGKNLLDIAIEAGCKLSIVEYLVQAGAFDINKKKVDGTNAMHLAVNSGDIDLARAFVKNGGNIHVTDSKARSFLHLAVAKNNLKLCKYFIESSINPDSQDNNGETPLHYAVSSQFQEIASFLIHSNAVINLEDVDGYTPVHLSAIKSPPILRLCLQRQGLATLRTFNGDCPLHLAASAGNEEAVTILLNSGLKGEWLNSLNNDNNTPRTLAEINGYRKIAELLATATQQLHTQ